MMNENSIFAVPEARGPWSTLIPWSVDLRQPPGRPDAIVT